MRWSDWFFIAQGVLHIASERGFRNQLIFAWQPKRERKLEYTHMPVTQLAQATKYHQYLPKFLTVHATRLLLRERVFFFFFVGTIFNGCMYGLPVST